MRPVVRSSRSSRPLALPQRFFAFKDYLNNGAHLFQGGLEAAREATVATGIKKTLSQNAHSQPMKRSILACNQLMKGQKFGHLLQILDDAAAREKKGEPVDPKSDVYKLVRMLRVKEAAQAQSETASVEPTAGTGIDTTKEVATGLSKAKAKGAARKKSSKSESQAGSSEQSVVHKIVTGKRTKSKLNDVASSSQPLSKETQKQKKKASDRKSAATSTTAPIVPKVSRPPKNASLLTPRLIPQDAIETEEKLNVPGLSFDLARVLFNPGVYQLQDPRSRVYNFDPYLENIMPVSDFNFDALNPYMTSSEDDTLRQISLKHQKRYIGSSSSMTAAMTQFHFLLSAWRPLNFTTLSQTVSSLTQLVPNYTVITRAPASIFLRWRNGVYAIDADKEHDSPNILMMQGKSMEKLLTLERDEFEKFRKSKENDQAAKIKIDPEAFHYSSCGDFLLRSQLDAYDPRLPGTGMFDLKTRAVAAVRMLLRDHESGMGYEIKDRLGLWESYEREYFDMIRSAFLKYSLQVRMGRMDGIFVAYHNIARIFGFQYIPISEMDVALHGQADTTLGDQEFRATVKLMNEIFDNATKEFPEQSLRIMFHTQKSTQAQPNGEMKIFAEPMSEQEIDSIQATGKAKINAYEKSMAAGTDPLKAARIAKMNAKKSIREAMNARPSTLESNAPDHAFLDEILAATSEYSQEEEPVVETVKERPLASWTLRIVNSVNGHSLVRPQNLSANDSWDIHYNLDRIKESKAANTALQRCRRTRDAALIFDDEDLESYNNGYFQNLKNISREGQKHRLQLTKADAGKPKQVWQSSPAQTAAVAAANEMNTTTAASQRHS